MTYNLQLLLQQQLLLLVQGGPKKRHKVNDTRILQPYVVKSYGFQQNVPKEILYMTEVCI